MLLLRISLLALVAFTSLSLAQDSRAVEVLQRAQKAAGGVEALAAVQDMILTREIRAINGGMSGQQTVKIILPGAFRQESSLPFGMMVLSLVDGAGKLTSPEGAFGLNPQQRAQAQGELFRIRERLLLADQAPELKLAYSESVDAGRAADVLEVTHDELGQSVRLWIDKQTGELFQTAYAGVALLGAQRLIERYSDFRTVNGIQIPFFTQVFAGDQLLTEIQVQKVLHNTGLTKAELR